MTARVSRNFTFQTGVHFNSTFNVNLYQVEVDFDIHTSVIREQNIAIERIKYFLELCLENSIFIEQSETDYIQKYTDADLRVCTLPEQPYDQMIAMMLMSKINSIVEGKLIATDMSLISRLSDNIYYKHSIEEDLGPFKDNGWWNENSLRISHAIKPNKTKKIVKLRKSSHTWEELYLTWAEPYEEISETQSEIVFANFDTKSDK